MENQTNIDPLDHLEPELTQIAHWPPIPAEELAKGNTLTPARLIELGALSGDPGSARWAFRLMALRDEIQRNAKAQGAPLSVRICKAGLHINTDAEAVEYHDARGENSLHSVRRQVAQLATVVDPTKLSPAEQARLDRALVVWGARMAALKRAGKSVVESVREIPAP